MPRLCLTLWLAAGALGLACHLPARAALRPLQGEARLRVVSQGSQGLEIELGFSSLEHLERNTDQGRFTELRLPGCSWRAQPGAPRLPLFRRILRVPPGASPRVRVSASSRESFALDELAAGLPLLPVQPSRSKSLLAPPPVFQWDSAAYAQSRSSELPAVRLEELGLLHGARLVALELDPVQWDAATGTLCVHNNLRLQVEFPGADEAAARDMELRRRSPLFQPVFERSLLNGEERPGRDAVTEYPVSLVVLTPPAFVEALQPFVDWKTRKGFRVITGVLGEPGVGSSRTSIKAWLQGLYDAATPEIPAPSCLLLMGDTNLLPTWTGGMGGHSTDLRYVTLEGADTLPDMLCGRISARDLPQLQNILAKTLEYEQYRMPDPSYLDLSLLVAGVDPDYSIPYTNGQIHYAETQYFNAAQGITADLYYYPQSEQAWVPAAVVADASEGRAFINYSGHGSETTWVDPLFTVSQVNSLDASHQYATVVGNCCVSNSFQLSTCFGEAWLRALDKGAVGYLGASNDSYWDEDYWWSVGAGPILEGGPGYAESGRGVYDGLFHTHGEDFSYWHSSQGAMLLCGGLAVLEAGSSYSSYYWEIYNLLGDPSLTPWLRVPASQSVTAPTELAVGGSRLSLVAEPFSYAGLSREGQWLAGGLVDESGNLELDFPPLEETGRAQLVVSHPQRQPVLLDLEVTPPTLEAPQLGLTRLGDGRIHLSWTAVAGAQRYQVWCTPGLESPWLPVAECHDTQLDLEGQREGASRLYRVTALWE